MNISQSDINKQGEQGAFTQGKMALLREPNFINAFFYSVLRYRIAQNIRLKPALTMYVNIPRICDSFKRDISYCFASSETIVPS